MNQEVVPFYQEIDIILGSMRGVIIPPVAGWVSSCPKNGSVLFEGEEAPKNYVGILWRAWIHFQQYIQCVGGSGVVNRKYWTPR